MYKITLFSFFFFSSVFTLAAQQTDADTADKAKIQINHDLGINATFLIDQFLNFNGSGLAENPYVFTYKMRLPKIAIRAAIGGDIENEEITEAGFDDKINKKAYTIDARLGAEYYKAFGKRWLGHFGLDLLTTFSRNERVEDSGFDKISNNSRSVGFGGGPVVGLSFFINENLSINTEGSFYVVHSNIENALLFEQVPDAKDAIQKITRQSSTLTLPASVFLVYTF